MRYPVVLTPDSGGYVVTFPDIPEALTQGDTREEALANAQDALITAFDFYFEDGEEVPPPGDITGEFVDVPINVAAKVLLLNSFLKSGLTQVELATRMGVKKQELTRLFNLGHSTKIDTMYKAMEALGKYLLVTEQIDVYTVEGAPWMLEKELIKGTQVIFAANTLTNPSRMKFYSALLKQNEHLEASFVVVGDIREIKGFKPDGVKFSRLPTSSIVGKIAALPVNSIIPA